MAKPPPYLGETCIKSRNDHYHNYTKKAKDMSFFAFLFSIFIIYITAFYLLNLSPYTLFNNTKFWFLMSNALILIIAADYGAFSSSKERKLDIYEQQYHLMQSHNQPIIRSINNTNASNSLVRPTLEQKQAPQEKCTSPKETNMLTLKEKKETSMGDRDHQNIQEPEERILEVIQNNPPKPKDLHEIIEADHAPHDHPLKGNRDYSRAYCEENANISQSRLVGRSKSERYSSKRVRFHESVNTSIKRSETTLKKDLKPSDDLVDQEENEFSKMTNEELNRRVQEFIERFNRQIRLQAVARNI